jgi:TRAP-type C4-dicarboxylate transport system permease small subunit
MADSGHWLPAADNNIRKLIMALSCVLLLLMVAFTGYTIIMRYVFDNAPFWGDTVSVFCNIWLVMLAHAITVRERSEIAMQGIYRHIPARAVMLLDLSWSVMTLAVGLLLIWFGYAAANGLNSEYWELGGLSKRYPMMILPLAGCLITLASLVNLIEDAVAISRGTYHLRFLERVPVVENDQ